MWVAKFKLKDDEDIYSPLCIKYRIQFFAIPYTQFTKSKNINLLVGGVISGSDEEKHKFVLELKKDVRVKRVEQHHDFILVHAQHNESREARAEIKIFYNPQYVRVKPVHVSSDGWEYWEIACLDRNELNKLVKSAIKYYHGELFSLKKEKIIKAITSLETTPHLTSKQLEALKTAFQEEYYTYPRTLTIPQLAKITKKSYSTFQEHLRKAESKIVEYFLKYR